MSSFHLVLQPSSIYYGTYYVPHCLSRVFSYSKVPFWYSVTYNGSDMIPKHTLLDVDLDLYTHFTLISKIPSVALIITKLSILKHYHEYHGHVSIGPYPLN